MKIKVTELLNRRNCIKKQQELLNELVPCDDDKTLRMLRIDSVDVEEIEAILEEYEDLLDSLLNSAEVNV